MGWIHELNNEKAAPAAVTLPRVALADIDIEAERQEAAIEVAKRKTIRIGLDALEQLQKADSQSFEKWCHVGRALKIGRDHALFVTGANPPLGPHYNREFGKWIDQYGFRLTDAARFYVVELVENITAIEAWRATLSDRLRRKLTHPSSIVRRWRKAIEPPKTKPDALMRAESAWRAFIAAAALAGPEDFGSERSTSSGSLAVHRDPPGLCNS